MKLANSMVELHFWLRCGNCGRLLTADDLGSLAIYFAEHMRDGHAGNWHSPIGGVCEEAHR